MMLRSFKKFLSVFPLSLAPPLTYEADSKGMAVSSNMNVSVGEVVRMALRTLGLVYVTTTAVTQGVLVVFRGRPVSQIGTPIVRGIAIKVSRVQLLGAWAEKRGGNELVNMRMALTAFTAKRYHSIAMAEEPLQQFTASVSTKKATDASQRRHFVVTFVANNATPLFGLEFFGGKFWIGHAVSSRLGNGLARPVQSLQRLFGPLCIFSMMCESLGAVVPVSDLKQGRVD